MVALFFGFPYGFGGVGFGGGGGLIGTGGCATGQLEA
jgi:hypothetical protein